MDNLCTAKLAGYDDVTCHEPSGSWVHDPSEHVGCTDSCILHTFQGPAPKVPPTVCYKALRDGGCPFGHVWAPVKAFYAGSGIVDLPLITYGDEEHLAISAEAAPSF